MINIVERNMGLCERKVIARERSVKGIGESDGISSEKDCRKRELS